MPKTISIPTNINNFFFLKLTNLIGALNNLLHLYFRVIIYKNWFKKYE